MTPPRLLRAALAASLCLARAGLAEPTYHLSKAPAFRPGDTAAVSLTEQTVLSVTDAEGKLLRHEKDATSQQLLDEVLTVDEAGRVTSFRQKIVLAEHRSWAGADREQPDATTRLADVFAVGPGALDDAGQIGRPVRLLPPVAPDFHPRHRAGQLDHRLAA